MIRLLEPLHQRTWIRYLSNCWEAYQASKRRLEEEVERGTEAGNLYRTIKDSNQPTQYA